MAFFIDLIPETGTFSDPSIEKSMSLFYSAIKSDTQTNLDERLQKLVMRIKHADAKIQSGKRIRRFSEVLSLGQFGAGSIGLAIAEIFETKSASPICEALFISRFITQTAINADRYPNLIPEDILQTYAVDRAELNSEKAFPVYDYLFNRAEQMIKFVPPHLCLNTPDNLAIYLLRHRLLTQKQISKLSGRNPLGCGVRLTFLEHSSLVLRTRRIFNVWSKTP
ncbi:MAG: hypothetical protein VYA17_16140 [Pseudomonadota bacterium]|nr:hypothetical protein [Pseudomonadota bacterium]